LGDIAGAVKDMTALGIPRTEMMFTIKNAQNPGARLTPGAMKRFGLYATPEQQEAVRRAQQAQPRP